MGWTKVSQSNAIDIKKEKGKSYIGTFESFKMIKTKIGDQIIWNFIGDDGVGFGIYGFTNLNRSMASVTKGLLCRITYVGTQNIKTKYGMKDVHQVTVEVDHSKGTAWDDEK